MIPRGRWRDDLRGAPRWREAPRPSCRLLSAVLRAVRVAVGRTAGALRLVARAGCGAERNGGRAAHERAEGQAHCDDSPRRAHANHLLDGGGADTRRARVQRHKLHGIRCRGLCQSVPQRVSTMQTAWHPGARLSQVPPSCERGPRTTAGPRRERRGPRGDGAAVPASKAARRARGERRASVRRRRSLGCRPWPVRG
jgi:hypothetical protein